jgi:hypothetical protein
MDESLREFFLLLSQVIFYLTVLCYAAIAVLAFVRFKTTVSGLLIGGGLSATTVLLLLFKIVFTVLKGKFGMASDASLVMSLVRTLVVLVLMVVVAVGVALIPSSLEKLLKRV